MAGVNATILEQLNSDVQLINQLGYYIVSGGGKRIRPMIAVLAARAVGYQGSAHVTIAALIEFIHTATLLHDDVVDESDSASRQSHGQCGVRQCRQRAGWRFPSVPAPSR